MIRLTREVRFSVDRDWAGRVEFTRPLTNSWAGWPSAVGLVPYLCLRATVEGEPDPRTGYLCNIKVIDELLRQHGIPHAAEQLERHGWRLPAERLLRQVFERVAAEAPPGAPLVKLELCATPYLRYAVERPRAAAASGRRAGPSPESLDMVYLTQQFEFAAAHRLHCPQLSDAENRAIFGKCNNANGHGHNYLLEVTLVGTPDPASGALTPLPKFEALVKERVIDRLDHKHLNEDTAEFREVNPSVENIARVVWSMLDGAFGDVTLHRVRVWETPKTCAEYSR
ncbi:MAG: 6-pyruvoyl tetrahydropterin synthase family protein [Phycisphaerae bacterium]